MESNPAYPDAGSQPAGPEGNPAGNTVHDVEDRALVKSWSFGMEAGANTGLGIDG